MPANRKDTEMPTFDGLMQPLVDALRQLGGSGSIEEIYAKTVELAGLSDEVLEARLYRPALPRGSHQCAPDFGVVHHEFKCPGVTLMLLLEEYATGSPLPAYTNSS